MVINSSNIPNDLSSEKITPETLPSIYRKYNTIDNYEGQDSGFYSAIDTEGWTGRKEARIRDKWIKIRVRYSGKNLAIIHSIITLFNVSPS
jgi:leucyl-tRNA synthetase